MRKFLINDDEIKMMNVEYHFQMAKDHSTTKGGGWWHFDDEQKKVWFYNTSFDYGRAKKEDLQELIEKEAYPMSFYDFKFYYSYSESLNDVFNDAVALN